MMFPQCVCFEMLMSVSDASVCSYVCVCISELHGPVEMSPLLSACVAPVT